MSVFKRPASEFYWFKFTFKGTLYQKPPRVKNKREAEKIEAAYRTLLANNAVGLEDPPQAPTLREFSQQFIDFVETRHADKPATVRFYTHRLSVLLKWEPVRNARLDRIDEAMIARYVGMRRKTVGVVSVNRELATLRRLLHLAQEWKIIKVIPKVKLLSGEPGRDFVLDHATERDYLAACPPLLRDVAALLLDTGLRLGEALALQWSSVCLSPVGGARYGWITGQGWEKQKRAPHGPLNHACKSRARSTTTLLRLSLGLPGRLA